VLNSLNGCSGLHYAGPGGSNHAVLTLISLCSSVGMTFEEFDTVCARIAHPESQLIHAAVRVAAWTGWAGDRIRRETRDEFIKEYGGPPIPTQELRRLDYQDTVAEMAQLRKIIEEKKNGK